MVERKPFHESVVRFIETASSGELHYVFGPLLKFTVIPANHDAITKAWRERSALMCVADNGVSESLEEQKRIIEEEQEPRQPYQPRKLHYKADTVIKALK